jgi:hypothetical protein
VTAAVNATLSETDLFAMVCLCSHFSGLPNNVWLASRQHARRSVRVLVQMGHRTRFDLDDLATISVEDDPPRLLEGTLSAADLAAVQRWIVLNRATILDHWHGRTDGAELARALRRLP